MSWFWIALFGALSIAFFLYHKKGVDHKRSPRGGMSQYGLMFGTAALFVTFAQFADVPWPITPLFWVVWVVSLIVMSLPGVKAKPGLLIAFVVFAFSTLTVLYFTPTPNNLFF